MKALSIKEPYASLIASGLKEYETRSWKTSYRGKILIHASKTQNRISKEYRQNAELMEIADRLPSFHFGEIIATADLVDCIPITERFTEELTAQEKAVGFYSVGRYAWKLENVKTVDPVKASGHLGLWEKDLQITY